VSRKSQGQRRQAARARSAAGSSPEIQLVSLDYDRAFNHLSQVLALSRTGKPPAVLDNLILTACTMTGEHPSDPAAVGELLTICFGLTVASSQVETAVARLAGSNRLARTGDGKLAVAGDVEDEISTRQASAEKLEEGVRLEWLALVESEGIALPDRDQAWRCLRKFMAVAFRAHGIRAAGLLTAHSGADSGASLPMASLLDEVLKVEECGPVADMATSIRLFFNTSSRDRTAYLAQYVDATFTFFALSVDEAASSYVRPTLPELKLFLDTNVLFGLLDLHDNPLGEVSKELVRFIQESGFPYKLYVHEVTLKEAQRTVSAIGDRLRGRRWTPELSLAALRMPYQLTGVEKRYHELNSQSPLELAVFLSRYEHIQELLQDKGVNLFREPMGEPYSTEEKALLIADYNAFVSQRRPDRKIRYEALDHDMALWLSVDAKRTPDPENALESGALLLTNDYTFNWFDRSEAERGRPAMVVLPNQLLQVLRPFGRPSEDFDQRFVESFAIPEFRTAYSDYGETASQVLSFLSAYSDLPTATAVRILSKEVLLDRLRGMDEESAEFGQLIESAVMEDNAALVSENQTLRQAHQAEKARLEQLELDKAAALIAEQERTASAEAAAAGEAKRAADAARATAEAESTTALAELRAEFDGRLAEVESGRTKTDAELERTRALIRYLGGTALTSVLLLLVALVPWATHWSWLEDHPKRLGLYLLASAIAVGLGLAVAVPKHRLLVFFGVVIAAVIAGFTLV